MEKKTKSTKLFGISKKLFIGIVSVAVLLVGTGISVGAYTYSNTQVAVQTGYAENMQIINTINQYNASITDEQKHDYDGYKVDKTLTLQFTTSEEQALAAIIDKNEQAFAAWDIVELSDVKNDLHEFMIAYDDARIQEELNKVQAQLDDSKVVNEANTDEKNAYNVIYTKIQEMIDNNSGVVARDAADTKFVLLTVGFSSKPYEDNFKELYQIDFNVLERIKKETQSTQESNSTPVYDDTDDYSEYYNNSGTTNSGGTGSGGTGNGGTNTGGGWDVDWGDQNNCYEPDPINNPGWQICG